MLLPASLLWISLASPGLGETAAAPAASQAFSPGETVERVACRNDPEQTYALYLPSGYTPERRWPVLLVMDPRGRAVPVLELFREAAEELGYIVVSSHDTRSDGPREPNVRALQAIFPDLEQRFSIDTRRHYLAGFSGTTRVAWAVGYLLPRRIAGIFGTGAGFPSDFDPGPGAPFVYFGSAGNTDFNFDEVWRLEATLDRMNLVSRFEFFDGPHSWPPAPVCRRALWWFEVQAMQADLAPRRRAIVEAFLAAEEERATEHEKAGRLYEARRIWRAMADDFAGLAPVEEARKKAAALDASQAVLSEAARRERLVAGDESHRQGFSEYLIRFQNEDIPLSRSIRMLDLKKLKQMAGENDAPESQAARRRLANIGTFMSFYLPRDLLQRGDPRRALASIDVARHVAPENPRLCFVEARAYATLRRKKKAFEALDCAAGTGHLRAAWLDSEPALEPLRDDPRFEELRRRAAGP